MSATDDATLERCCRLVDIELRAVALQRRRLRSSEPEDTDFVMRWWTDRGFLIVALLRLRRAAGVALGTSYASPAVRSALAAFDTATPSLRLMRDIGEHTDAYATDTPNRHVKTIDRRQLEVGQWDGTVFRWLQKPDGTPHQLSIDTALAAAEDLFRVLDRGSVDQVVDPSQSAADEHCSAEQVRRETAGADNRFHLVLAASVEVVLKLGDRRGKRRVTDEACQSSNCDF
jgi:hypothetical protein